MVIRKLKEGEKIGQLKVENKTSVTYICGVLINLRIQIILRIILLYY